MNKQALDALQAGLAQAQTPADIATLINNLATGNEAIGTAIGAAQAVDSALGIAGKAIPGGVVFDLAAFGVDVNKARKEYNGDFTGQGVPAGHIKASMCATGKRLHGDRC